MRPILRQGSGRGAATPRLPAAQRRSVESLGVPIILFVDFKLCKYSIPLGVVKALPARSATAPLVPGQRGQRYIQRLIDAAHDCMCPFPHWFTTSGQIPAGTSSNDISRGLARKWMYERAGSTGFLPAP